FENTMMDEVKFSARRTIGGETKDYLVITLKEASVTDYELAPSTGEPDLIEDRVSFAYKLINFNYDGEHEIEMDVHVGK
ncbi:MAG: type VI secretion system tube protein Hcp, partial [Rhizobiaceae bacterium]